MKKRKIAQYALVSTLIVTILGGTYIVGAEHSEVETQTTEPENQKEEIEVSTDRERDESLKIDAENTEIEIKIEDQEHQKDQAVLSSYTWGTCALDISESGVLTIGEGTLSESDGLSSIAGINKMNVTKIVFSGKVVAPSNSANLFSNYSGLRTYENMENFDTSQIVNAESMFKKNPNSNQLDVSGFDTSKITNMKDMFSSNGYALLDVSNWDTSNVTDMSNMFADSKPFSLDVSNWNTSNVTDMSSMFSGSNVSSLELSNWDTSNVTNMSSMFSRSSVSSIEPNNWDTSKVTNMSSMFSGSSVSSLKLNNWDTSNVTNMSGLFASSSMSSLDLNNWDISNVTDTSSMFSGSSMSSLELKDWDTSNVTNMRKMFDHSKVKSLEINNWNTSNVLDMTSLFEYCRNLRTLDIGNWDTSKAVTDCMFRNNYIYALDLRNCTFRDPTDIFADTSIQKLTLGREASFSLKAGMPPVDDNYGGNTGMWENEDGSKVFADSNEFMSLYNGKTDAGTYVVQRTVGNPVTITYKTTEGEILDQMVLNGWVWENFEIPRKEFEGYELIAPYPPAKGMFDDDPYNLQTYECLYKKVEERDVVVQYLDEDGDALAEEDILVGEQGTMYTTTPKNIPGYEVITIPTNATGTFDKANSQTVIYVYRVGKVHSFALNYVGVQQQEVVGFLPSNVQTDSVRLAVKKERDVKWVDTGYTAQPDVGTGYFAIESRFKKGTNTFLLDNKDQVKVSFVDTDGNYYEGLQVVEPYRAPVVNDYVEGEANVTGHVENGVNQVRLSVNGKPMRVVNNSPFLSDNAAGINAVTGDFSIWGKTWCQGEYGIGPIHQTKVGDVITIDYGVQIYGALNNPSTSIKVK